MNSVADAGPLMALAKIGGLATLFRLFPRIVTPPAVYEETVTAGLRLRAPDAAILQSAYEAQRLKVLTPSLPSLPLTSALGRGEEESIRLAIEKRADWLLIDDREARRAAEANFRAAGISTKLKGTLGVLVTASSNGILSTAEAVDLVSAIERRTDIWIHKGLCRQVRGALLRDC